MKRLGPLMLAATLALPVFLAGLLPAGCSEPTGPRTVLSRELSIKIPAIKHAVRQKDTSAFAEMVRELDDDDPAVRLYAIQGLQRLTGKDFGYRYYDDKEAREAAVAKWKNWLKEQKN